MTENTKIAAYYTSIAQHPFDNAGPGLTAVAIAYAIIAIGLAAMLVFSSAPGKAMQEPAGSHASSIASDLAVIPANLPIGVTDGAGYAGLEPRPRRRPARSHRPMRRQSRRMSCANRAASKIVSPRSRESNMFEFETSMSRPTANELHRRARREQSEAVNAFTRSVVRNLARWVGTLAGSGIKPTRALAGEWRLRRDIRTLRRLGDRRSATWA